jgi:hypothetical protein
LPYETGNSDAMLRQGLSYPCLLHLAGLRPGVLQPFDWCVRPQIAGQVLAGIRDQPDALVAVKRRIVLPGRYLTSQVSHRPDLDKSVLDQQQARVLRNCVMRAFSPAHQLILRHAGASRKPGAAIKIIGGTRRHDPQDRIRPPRAAKATFAPGGSLHKHTV